ncbi:DUF983 domain-containing protein [Mesorhizobium sp. 113-1-2]|uniref:DUF983 domain-containing protein n=1 Tax=Mesorhizobium sp. 113-1-2 TaxID=2744515 RepID=UPI00237A5B82|nr:DUF983 domain-containing protein [Mesorhizobium sp. 113-1-2]
MGRCPNCGQGKLYRTYQKQVERCAVCGERFGDIESDDAAPWFTVLIAGVFAAPCISCSKGFFCYTSPSQ